MRQCTFVSSKAMTSTAIKFAAIVTVNNTSCLLCLPTVRLQQDLQQTLQTILDARHTSSTLGPVHSIVSSRNLILT